MRIEMKSDFPKYQFDAKDVQQQLVKFVRLNEPDSYVFDTFHSHEYNEVLFFIKGGGNHNVNFKDYTIKDFSIHHLANNDLHWVEREKTSKGFAIMYKDQLLYKLQELNMSINYVTFFKNSVIINLDADEQSDFEFMINELFTKSHQPEYLLQLFAAFLTKIAVLKKVDQPTNNNYDPIIHEVIDLVETNYKKQLSLKDYASMLNLAPRTLHNRINKVSGKTIKTLQNDRLLKEAKRLICTSNKTISEIAFELGFNDSAYFSNWFKKQTGIIPSEYRVSS